MARTRERVPYRNNRNKDCEESKADACRRKALRLSGNGTLSPYDLPETSFVPGNVLPKLLNRKKEFEPFIRRTKVDEA